MPRIERVHQNTPEWQPLPHVINSRSPEQNRRVTKGLTESWSKYERDMEPWTS